MKFWSDSFSDGAYIPGPYAFCIIDPTSHVGLSANRNPHLAWQDLPAGTRSLAIICHDMDVPSRGDDVNQEGRSIPADLPRVDFFHWTLIDLPISTTHIAAGAFSDGVLAHGKSGPAVAGHTGLRHGLNDYTGWFAADPAMQGQYFGYDGPCPPWNDTVIHRYAFTLYALDVARLAVEGAFTGPQLRHAMTAHILTQEMLVGLYTLNPFLAEPQYGSAAGA